MAIPHILEEKLPTTTPEGSSLNGFHPPIQDPRSTGSTEAQEAHPPTATTNVVRHQIRTRKQKSLLEFQINGNKGSVHMGKACHHQCAPSTPYCHECTHTSPSHRDLCTHSLLKLAHVRMHTHYNPSNSDIIKTPHI